MHISAYYLLKSFTHSCRFFAAIVALVFVVFTTSVNAQSHNKTGLEKSDETGNQVHVEVSDVIECDKEPCTEEFNFSDLELEDIYRPGPTNSAWEELDISQEFYDSPYRVSLFTSPNGEDSKRLLSQTKAIFAMGFGVIGVIALLPEDVSNWERGEIFGKWGENVRNGPVWDRDGFALNVIGHGYFGGVYYQVARKSGYRQWDAFLYSLMGSTFYWEYGIEAFAEVPSIQDLVITPLLGWAYGEWAFQTEKKIIGNNSTVLGSETLGSVSLFFLDPIDRASSGINNLFGHEVFVAGTGYFDIKDMPVGVDGDKESLVQMGVTYKFGSGKKQGSNANHASYYSHEDPVTSSIIGLSIGAGQTGFDEAWGVQDATHTEMTIGLYFTKGFSTRLSYAKGDAEKTDSKEKVRFENYNLSAQYYFNDQGNFRPYLMAGFGELMFEEDREKKTFQTHLGLGMHYKFTKNLSLQTDARAFHSASSKTVETTFGANIVYRLFNGE